MALHCMGQRCKFKGDKTIRNQVRCIICCIWHHIECVKVEIDEMDLAWSCPVCRTLPSDVKGLTKLFESFVNNFNTEMKELKNSKEEMCNSLKKITENLEEEKGARINAEKELASVQTQLSDLTKQLTNVKSCMSEQVTPSAPPSQVTPTAPPPPSLLLGTSLLRNVDPKKLKNWEVKAVGGATIEGIHKELNALPESKDYNEIIVVCGSIDLDNKSVPEIIAEYQALTVSASLRTDKVMISSILPRNDKKLKEKTKGVNEGLKSMCDNDGYHFIDNDPSFHLMNGEINDACLTNDGLHLSKRGLDSLLHTCGVLQTGSAFTSARYSDSEESNALLFNGHKHPLSNFYPMNIEIKGKCFKSTEAAYQYEKAEAMGNSHAAKSIQEADTGLQAMRIASRITTDDRWLHKKYSVMESIIKEKLKVCDAARNMLIKSGSKKIVENTSHEFWGRGKNGQGQNMLGKLWMDLRKQLQRDPNYMKGQSKPQRERTWANRSYQPRCRKCGESGHVERQCRKVDAVTCWACGRTGHKQKHCRQFSGHTYYPRQYQATHHY